MGEASCNPSKNWDFIFLKESKILNCNDKAVLGEATIESNP